MHFLRCAGVAEENMSLMAFVTESGCGQEREELGISLGSLRS